MKTTEYGLNDLILGIDVGPTSIGWALVAENNRAPVSLVDTGVRIFEAGVDKEDAIESGRDESRATARREARLHRRQLWLRAFRMKKLMETMDRPRFRCEMRCQLPRNIIISQRCSKSLNRRRKSIQKWGLSLVFS